MKEEPSILFTLSNHPPSGQMKEKYTDNLNDFWEFESLTWNRWENALVWGARGRRLPTPLSWMKCKAPQEASPCPSDPWQALSIYKRQPLFYVVLEHAALKKMEGKSRSTNVTTVLGFGELVFLTKLITLTKLKRICQMFTCLGGCGSGLGSQIST